MAVNLSKQGMSTQDIMGKIISEHGYLNENQQKAIQNELNKRPLTVEEQKQKELMEYQYDREGLDASPSYQKLLVGGTGILKSGRITSTLRNQSYDEAKRKFDLASKGISNPRFADLSPDAIKAIEESDKIESTRRKAIINQEEQARLRNQIKALEPQKTKINISDAIDGIMGTGTSAVGVDERLRGIKPIVRPGGKPVPGDSDLVGSFERANEVFTNFTNNFGKQIEALNNIPRVIDMNINQRVELIINGAEALTRIEPGVSAMVESGISRAMEVLRDQLGDYNIRINL